MDILVLKSFIPEIFLSLIILAQLLFNTHITNNLNFNFPTINKELFIQTFFILFCLFLLLLNLKIEGFFTNFLLCNEEGGRSIKLLFILCSLFVLTYVVKSFSVQKLNFFEFFYIFLFSILSLLLLVSTHDLLSSYLALEMQALCFYILASFKRNSAFSTEAGLKYFVSGSFISCIFLLGASLIYGSLGTLNFNSLNQLLSFKFEQELDYLTYFIVFGSSCIISTLLFKISAAPFHFWSPDVYEGAPLSSTTIFSVLPKVVLFSFLINWINTISTLSCFSSNILIFSGVLSVCIGTFFALRQKRMKRFIIYSSIAQVGFPVIAMSFPFLNSFISIYFFLIVYTLTSILVWGHYTLAYTCQQKLNSFLKQDSSLLFISSFSNLFYTNKIWSLSFLWTQSPGSPHRLEVFQQDLPLRDICRTE